MKRDSINYVNSWNKSFKNKASMVDCLKAVIEGVWVSGRNDVEDIILNTNVRIVKNLFHSGNGWYVKDFGLEPITLEILRYNDKTKESKWVDLYLRDKDKYWSFDLYELRRAVTKRGLGFSKEYNITETEVRELFNKYHYDDKSAYEELMKNRPDLYQSFRGSYKKYEKVLECEYSTIRAAYCPCLDPLYNWANDLDKAGITKEQQEEFAYEKMKDYIR